MSGGDGGEVDTRRGEKEGNDEVPVPNLVPEDTNGGPGGGEVVQGEVEAGEDYAGGVRGGDEEEIEGQKEQGGGVAHAGGIGE